MSKTVAVAALALLLVGGCKKKPKAGSGPSRSPSASAAAGEVPFVIAYGSEKKGWLEEQLAAFEQSAPTTRSGKRIRVTGKAMGSGEATRAILTGELRPLVFSPASSAYLTLLNDEYLRQAGHTKVLFPPGDLLVLSPIVIAMWRPMAEALGWPHKQLGWRDLLAVARDAKGWGAFGHPEWGRFKLGHTHPEFSNSGLLAVLAEAYAGAGKTRDLSAAELDDPKVQAFIASVENTIVHYGKSTGFFADKMLERGPGYLSAAVLYENLVIESYAKPGSDRLVAIYPVEGTFWSDHPYSIIDGASAEEREAAETLLAFLKARPAQERALAFGFRPGDAAIPIAAPIDAEHGADPKQPQTLLDLPPGDVLGKVLAVWRANKKVADVIFVFDKSGSMQGEPLEEAKQGAVSFLSNLDARDQVTLVFFDDKVHDAIGPWTIGKKKDELAARISGVIAGGGTAMYDATAAAYALAQQRVRAAPGVIHAVVVMTDGRDTNSTLTLEALRARFGDEDPVKVFTIAYGSETDPKVLADIAEAARGATAKGSVESIVEVYRDMASFF